MINNVDSEELLMAWRRAIETQYGEPLLEANLDFSQMYQGLTFKSGVDKLYGISQGNIYAGSWITFHWGKEFPDCFTRRYFFLNERERIEEWLAECRRAYERNRRA